MERQGAGRGSAAPGGGALQAHLRRPRRRRGEGEGRAGLSHRRDDGRQDAAAEAAERDRRSAGAELGGHQLNTPALRSIPVGVVVERLKATSPWLDFVWRPAAVLPGLPSAEPWTAIGTTQGPAG